MLTFGRNKRTPPMSNTERQRLFRERNPGYYGRLHRKRKAQVRAALAQRAMLAAAVPQPRRLLLPAPVVSSEQLMLFDMIQRVQEREMVPIKRADELGHQ